MESLLTSLPNPKMSLPLGIFEQEFVLSLSLLMLLVIFFTYQKWKQMEQDETENIHSLTLPSREDTREQFKNKILELSPDDPNFGDDIVEILRQYLATNSNIHLSPMLTAEQLQKELPAVLGEVFILIRNIRYAPKGKHAQACSDIQSHLIELIDAHAI